jgi:aminopeptidase N
VTGRRAAPLAVALAALGGAVRAQAPAQGPAIDVVSYGFEIVLPDTGRTIVASATIVFDRRAGSPDTLPLDLVGLTVDSAGTRAGDLRVPQPFVRLPYVYDGARLKVALPAASRTSENVTVYYHGVPQDGLIAQRDARGRMTFFGDNWPERARCWLPTVDEPDDKAEVLWLVSAPPRWLVVANGALARVGRSPSGRLWWAYTEHRPIPTYTMVIGAGEMTLSRHRSVVSGRDTIPIEVWASPEDSAFADSVPFRRATEIVEAMQQLVGPFPYEKLAHVESSTRYGGMENASAIFYAEQPYLTRRMGEAVVRHETAHQWFGDAVTERDFHHLWLSEGFASYFDLVVGARLDGDSVLLRGLRRDAETYLRSRDVDRPILDTTVTDLTQLLNTNSYQKGAWVLHMLRRLVGDSAFWIGIRDYYRTYRDSSVLSEDFQRVMERAAGRRLGWFFTQWLRQPGYPQLDVAWHLRAGGHGVVLEVRQAQPAAWGTFAAPDLPVEFRRAGSVLARRVFDLRAEAGAQTATFTLEQTPDAVAVDPDGTVLLTARVRP